MPENVKAYDLLFSFPSDVFEYIEILEKEVGHFNRTWGRRNKIIVRTIHWSEDAYSEFGNHPQKLLNKQIVDSSDMVLGVFWTRFGTATENYSSGTEEEIERMLSMKKQIFLFFMDKPVELSKVDYKQYDKVSDFKERYKNKGIYFCVKDENELAKKFGENLMLYFGSLMNGDSFKKKNSKTKILWVDDRPENNVYERNVLEKYGLKFTLALSTEQALQFMENDKFALIISDMERKEGKKEGYILLEEIRKLNKRIPFIIYTNSAQKDYFNETVEIGGQGNTNEPIRLIELVIKNLLNSSED